MDLFVAEKPSLGKEIAQHLGPITKTERSHLEIDGGRIIVTWAVGHIFELEMPDYYIGANKPWSYDDLPIFPAKMKLRCTNPGQFKVISAFAKKANRIVHAGDPDREGQLLVDEIFIEAGLDPCQPNFLRIGLSALDAASIKKALGSLRPNREFVNERYAALARQHCDWYVGMNVSRAMSISSGATCHMGRVKTPVLAMVVKRDEEIENFAPKDYFVPWVIVAKQRFNYVGSTKEFPVLDDAGRVINEEYAKKVSGFCKTADFEVFESKSEVVRVSPPLPHNLGSLQMEMNRKYGLSAQDTLGLAQSLYEKHKLTTYPRTDSRYLPQSMIADRQAVLGSIHPLYSAQIAGCRAEVISKCFNDKKVTAHHAIIPTGKKPDLSTLNDLEKKVFDAVCKSYIIQMYPDAQIQKDKVVLRYGALFDFAAYGSAILDAQWKAVVGELDIDEEKDESL